MRETYPLRAVYDLRFASVTDARARLALLGDAARQARATLESCVRGLHAFDAQTIQAATACAVGTAADLAAQHAYLAARKIERLGRLEEMKTAQQVLARADLAAREGLAVLTNARAELRAIELHRESWNALRLARLARAEEVETEERTSGIYVKMAHASRRAQSR